MIATSGAGGVQTDMLASDVPDAYVWEYWMRVAAKAGSSSATYTAIITDLASQYDVITETFNVGASRRSDFDNTVWPSLATKDQYHAYFPNAYERGWMVAFDALDFDANEWKDLPGSAASTIDGDAVSIPFPAKTGAPAPPTTYPSFKVPGDTLAIDVYNGTIPYSLAGIVDADPNPKDIPNFFLGSWEDLPALSFAGGVLDMHGHANISGMLYTPDSSEIEAKKDKYAPFQYANGALLIGNGIYLEDGGTGDHSMIGIVFNDHTFDHLRSKASFNIHGPQTVREIMGQ
jgi:hypothetical protein